MSSHAAKVITSTLEVERKFVPTTLSKKLAAETSHKSAFSQGFPKTNLRDSFVTHPRLRIIDKYFDDPYRNLEKQSIWIRFRRSQPTSPCGKDILDEVKRPVGGENQTGR